MLSDIIFPRKQSSRAARYLFAAAAAAVAFALRLLLEPVLHDRSPLLVFTLAVAVSAIRGGFGPGLLATIISMIGAVYFFPPEGSVLAIDAPYRSSASVQLMILVIIGFVLSWLTGELHKLRWQSLHLVSELQAAVAQRDAALANVRLLSGLLPICANCKKIRDKDGVWRQMESYVETHSEAQFSHGVCPDCAKNYYSELERQG